jgi:hypothetical protein
MNIVLPTGKRKPVAYAVKESYIYFVFDERDDQFIVKSNNKSTFFFDNCRDCQLLLKGLCSGGSPTPPPIIPDSTIRVPCTYYYKYDDKPVFFRAKLLPHVFRFYCGSSLNYSRVNFYFVGSTSTTECLDLSPYLIGNMIDTGQLCTEARATNNDVGLCIDTLFDKCVWNADHCGYWLDIIQHHSKSEKGIDYSSQLQIEWIKEFSNNSPLVQETYPKMDYIKCDDLVEIEANQTHISV